MPNVSKIISDRGKVTSTVVNALEVRGSGVAAALSQVLFPDGAPPNCDVGVFLGALSGALTRAQDQLEEADLAHAEELGDDPAARDLRDNARAALVELVQTVRAGLPIAFGARALGRIDLQTMPRGDRELISGARNSAKHLTPAVLGPAVSDLVTLDLPVLRERLVQAADAFSGALGGVERERREAQQTLERRDEAADLWRRSYVGVADTFTALATFAGFDEVAGRVKPTARRRAGRPELLDEVSEDADEDNADEDSADEDNKPV